MQVSATILGKDYGVNGEEMNRILVKQGFLTGQPGNYSVTEKALEYAIEKDFHKGTGGYSQYNRYWTTRTFDDSIKKALDVTPKLIEDVRKELSEERAIRYAVQAAERAKANADFLAKEAAKKAVVEAAEKAAQSKKIFIIKCKKVGLIGTIIAGIFVGGYSIYKLTPKIKRWWESHKKDKKKTSKVEEKS